MDQANCAIDTIRLAAPDTETGDGKQAVLAWAPLERVAGGQGGLNLGWQAGPSPGARITAAERAASAARSVVARHRGLCRGGW
jgi:hypothetical protein